LLDKRLSVMMEVLYKEHRGSLLVVEGRFDWLGDDEGRGITQILFVLFV